MAKRKPRSEDDTSPDDPRAAGGASIEIAMQELAAIVSMLESGQGTLDESLSQFERGTALLRTCHRQLDAAAQRIEIVTRTTETGEMLTTEFEAGATHQRQDRTRTQTRKVDDAEDDDPESRDSLF